MIWEGGDLEGGDVTSEGKVDKNKDAASKVKYIKFLKFLKRCTRPQKSDVLHEDQILYTACGRNTSPHKW